MKDEDGVTLAEVLVALFVLSLLAANLAGIIQNLLGNWERTAERFEAADELADFNTRIHQIEQQPTTEQPLFLYTDDNLTFTLAKPKTDQTAACVYDLVGRRCR